MNSVRRENPWCPTRAPYRKRGYLVRSLRSVLDQLKETAIKFALIALLIAGFIMAALFAVDLLTL